MSNFARRVLRERRRDALKAVPEDVKIDDQFPFAGIKVSIASPMMDMCNSQFTVSLVRMMGWTMMNAPGMALNFLHCSTSIIPISRQLLVAQALDNGSTHILFVDSDMTFPEDMVLRMLSHSVDVVGANCMTRRSPWRLTAQIDGKEVITNYESKGIEPIDRIGTGILMVGMHVFKKMDLPWFEYEWMPELNIFRGEDYVFCKKVKDLGFDIYVDHDVSKQVEHIGQFGLNPLMRERILAMQGAPST